MIREAASSNNGTKKNRKQASGSTSGRSLANTLKESARKEAESLLQLRAQATASVVAEMMGNGEYFQMVWQEMEGIFGESQAVLEGDICQIEEAFLLPPSSSTAAIEEGVDLCSNS